MKYKVGTSKIQGKGLIAKKPIKKGERIGTAHVNGVPTSVVGKYHNHEDEPTAINVKEGNKRYLIADRDLMPGDEITTNYRLQPELEQPEDFKKGGAVRLPKMPKPSKKGVLAKGYSRSLDATNRLFTEHVLFKKPKSKKNKVFDPNANYQEGGFIETELTDEEIQGYRDGGYVVEEIDEYKQGGALLTKKVKCKKCGWKWDAADGGNDVTTCHKCGGQGLVQKQDGGVYTHPGRPGAKYLKRDDGWYVQSPNKEGYVKVQDPQGNRTKELNKSAVLTDEVYAFSPSQSNYINDSVPLNRAVSESTDTQASRNLTKSIEGRKVDESNRAIVQRANMRDSYRQDIENNPKLSAETKQRMLSEFNNLSLVDQNKSAYLTLSKKVNPDQVKPLTEPLGASAWTIITNPFDAFKASIVYGDFRQLPRNYNAAKMFGVNMTPRSYQERFALGQDGQGGKNIVGNFLNQTVNPLDMGDKVYKYARKGDYLNAGLNLARFAPMLYTAPGAKVLDYLDDVGSAVGTVMNKSPLARFTNSSSSPLIQAVGKSLNADNLITTKGITSGLLNLKDVANTGLQYYQTGKDADLKNFAGEALSSAASLAPFAGTKVLSKINPYRTTYFGTKAGFDLMNKPEQEDAALGIPSLLRTFNVKQEGGTIETELTDEEIQNLLAEGYIIEELD